MLAFLRQLFFQPVRPFPTTQAVAYHLKSNLLSRISGLKPFSSLMYVIPRWRQQVTQLDTNERIVELPFVFHHVDFKRRGKVLDVGCCESTVGLSLATLGFAVTGIDIRPYELSHPNFTFVQADICQTTLSPQSFDYITCISTLEHIGLDSLYGRGDEKSSDVRAVSQFFALLKPGGKLLLTIPCAQTSYQDNFLRIYTPRQLSRLTKAFSTQEEHYFRPAADRRYWEETTASGLPFSPVFGVCLLVLQKPNRASKLKKKS